MATANKKVSAAAKKVSDDVTAVEIEAKKTTRAASRKAKESVAKVATEVKEEVKKPVRKAKAAKMMLVFESRMGGKITPEEIATMVPKGTEAAYIKLEENKIYWVKGEETGAIDIW